MHKILGYQYNGIFIYEVQVDTDICDAQKKESGRYAEAQLRIYSGHTLIGFPLRQSAIQFYSSIKTD